MTAITRFGYVGYGVQPPAVLASGGATLSATEAPDTASFGAAVAATLALAAAEAPDTASFSASVPLADLTIELVSNDGVDVASMSVYNSIVTMQEVWTEIPPKSPGWTGLTG
jgi:hypothetical protein